MLTNYYRSGRTGIIQASDVPTLNQNTTGSAATLTTSRTFQTNLASTSTASFNGSASVTPGVTGTLPVANGGTGINSITQFRIPYATANNTLSSSDKLRYITDNQFAFTVGDRSINIGTGVYSANQPLVSVFVGHNIASKSKFIDPGQNVFLGALVATNDSLNGSYNMGLGYSALYNITTSDNNTSIGALSLLSQTIGDNNTAIGYGSGFGVGTNSNTTGSNNTFIGYESVGASATASNVITLGNSSIATIRAQVTTITSLSDIRDKTNIMPLNYGIDFIKKLNPVSFDWDMRDGGKIGISEIGFIAQELQQAQIDSQINIPNLVSDINPDKLEASYGVLIPIIVKALKEQQTLIDELKQRIINLENK
jgi:hypothetical protein